ncbi:uncharacterized protein LOC125162190 isoform X4 [Prionailurus viverrinus]|uniref:uncharacterized protein LOC125162190 isoform X4 n=1 Tax=Prionailurus viverrinus TaxID=61388 RepID=UPI001FF2528A|nr:uncharacterized protein LOC125162190 isoform X4 [Prionailurus viverrinus]
MPGEKVLGEAWTTTAVQGRSPRKLLLLALVSPASQGASSDAKKPLMSPPPVGCRERGLCWNCGSSHGRPWLEQETGQQLEDSRFYSQKAVVPQTKEPCIPGSPLGHLKTEAATEALVPCSSHSTQPVVPVHVFSSHQTVNSATAERMFSSSSCPTAWLTEGTGRVQGLHH